MWSSSLHFARRRVALLGDDLILHGLALLVLDRQQLVGLRIDEFHLDLSIFSIASLVARLVGQRVLVAQGFRDGLINSGELAVEARKVRLTAGFPSKRLHLIVGLQE